MNLEHVKTGYVFSAELRKSMQELYTRSVRFCERDEAAKRLTLLDTLTLFSDLKARAYSFGASLISPDLVPAFGSGAGLSISGTCEQS